jgi:biopolymer transport protein ExbB/TolQ
MSLGKRFAVVASSAALCGLIHGALLLLTRPGDRLYALIYDRGFVQYLTLYMAALVVVLLLVRQGKHRRERFLLEAAQRQPSVPPGPLGEAVASVAAAHEEQGAAAAAARIARLAEERQTEVQRAYEAIHFLTGTLPALGLFGTLLGLSDALFAAFSGGALDSGALQQFVTGLATAMDTTVLGMACAAPLVGSAWLLSRREEALVEHCARYLRERFGVQDAPLADRTTGILQMGLRRLTQKVAEEAKVTFGRLLETSAQTYREQLEHAVQAVLAAQRAHDERMVHRLAAHVGESLRESLGAVGTLITEHNGHTAEAIVHEVGRLRAALRRCTPEEVVIVYPQTGRVNNHGHSRRAVPARTAREERLPSDAAAEPADGAVRAITAPARPSSGLHLTSTNPSSHSAQESGHG